MKKIPFILLVILIVAQPLSLSAANHYVLDGGTGDCSDWTNACGDLPATLTRGDTYYVGDGAYVAYTFDDACVDACDATDLITIKKATAADHGTETGWQAAYGDGTATFPALTFSTSYWLFDGQVGGGPLAWSSGHGFVVYRVTDSCGDNGNLITLGTAVSNISIRHTKAYSDYSAYTINGIKGVSGASNITISYCQISDLFGVPFHIGNWTDSTIEYSYIYHNKSTGTGGTPCADWHSEGISSLGTNSNITIRWNLWDRIEGTAVLAGITITTSDNWKIYGNIFSRSAATIYYYWEPPGSNQAQLTNSYFLNNVIVGQGPAGNSVGGLAIQNGTGNVAYNNIWYSNIGATFDLNVAIHNYQYGDSNARVDDEYWCPQTGCCPETPCDRDTELVTGEANGTANAGNPFVGYNSDPLVANLQLNVNRTGYDTSALVAGNSTDMLGNTRTTWSRGALEYGGGGAATHIVTASTSSPCSVSPASQAIADGQTATITLTCPSSYTISTITGITGSGSWNAGHTTYTYTTAAIDADKPDVVFNVRGRIYSGYR